MKKQEKSLSYFFSIILILGGFGLIISFAFNQQPWINAPKVIAIGHISKIHFCKKYENYSVCDATISRTRYQPSIWHVKTDKKLYLNEKVYRYCWLTPDHVKPVCFKNSMTKLFGPWKSAPSL